MVAVGFLASWLDRPVVTERQGPQPIDRKVAASSPTSSPSTPSHQGTDPTDGDPDPSPLPPPCVSYGYVTWPDGKPAEGARIQILLVTRQTEDGPRWEDTGANTDSDGFYELNRREVCPLRLAAWVPAKGRGEEMAAPVLDEDEDATRIRRDIMLDEAFALRGIVRDERGAVVAQGEVSALGTWALTSNPVDADHTREVIARMNANRATIGVDGRFEFPALPAADWTLTVACETYEPTIVTLAEEDIRNEQLIEVTVKDPRCLDVFVVDSEGHGIPGEVTRHVYYQDPGPDVSFATDNAGHVEVCGGVIIGTKLIACAQGFDCRKAKIENTDDDVVIELGGAGQIQIRAVVEGEATTAWIVFMTTPDHPLTFPQEIPANETVIYEHAPVGTGIMMLYGGGPQSTLWKGEITVEHGQTLELGVVHVETSEDAPESQIDRSPWNPLGH